MKPGPWKSAAISLAACVGLSSCSVWLCSCSGAPSSPLPTAPPTFSVQLGTETTLLTTAQRAAFGIQYGPPDGTLGVYFNAGTYTFFGASRSASTNCSGTPAVQGTYRFGGTLTSITAPYGCTAIIQPGNDPNGYTFDRDYAGGGPVLPVTSATGTAGLLHIYHGEYHAGTCANLGTCFYASLGMALSTNGGATFTKLGEIVQPYVTRSSILNNNLNLDIGGGTLLLADQNGAHIANLATANPANVYLYVFYTDRDPSAAAANPCNTTSCVAVARAQLSTVVAAAFAGNTAAFPTLFQKYYQGGWTQPATSSDPNAATNAGHYTPVVAASADFPSVVYDTSTQQYVMAYGADNNSVAMVYGATLLSWSAPIASGAIAYTGAGLVYPTLVGESSDPTVSNGSPYLYYVHSPNAWPDWPDANVVYRQLHTTYQ
jgi:hypothetical protein